LFVPPVLLANLSLSPFLRRNEFSLGGAVSSVEGGKDRGLVE
jgi:hypothetical protein